MYVIGLTGGIGTGKSSAAKIFQHLEIEVIDTDSIARTVVEPGMPALAKIVKHFGDEVLDLDDRLDRQELGKIVFNNPEERKWLENLLHPLINTQAQSEITAAQSEYVVLMSPLLFESDQAKLTNRVLLIDCEQQHQEERVVARSKLPVEHVRKIIAAQMQREERIKLADDTIANNGSLSDLIAAVQKQHQIYLDYAMGHMDYQ